jgi:translation initiation factor 2B subunit (eIF-2B alpha/beta/delta family)
MPTRPETTLDQRIEKLRYDRTSGALDLAIEAIGLAETWIAAGKPLPRLAAELAKMHPAIAALANVARLLREESDGLPQRLHEVKDSLIHGNQMIAENLREFIPPTSRVITLSNSTTVRDVLVALRVRAVYVLESQPGGEGKQLAEALRSGLRPAAGTVSRQEVVHLIPDSAIGNIVPQVDCAVIGVDTFDRTGAVVHKVGTLPLALCCKHFGKAFYAVGHSLKFTERRLEDSLPEPDQALESQLFDCTPGDLVTRLITERKPSS